MVCHHQSGGLPQFCTAMQKHVLPEFHTISRSIVPDFEDLARQKCFQNCREKLNVHSALRQDVSSAGRLAAHLPMETRCLSCPAVPQVVAPAVGETNVEQQVPNASTDGSTSKDLSAECSSNFGILYADHPSMKSRNVHSSNLPFTQHVVGS